MQSPESSLAFLLKSAAGWISKAKEKLPNNMERRVRAFELDGICREISLAVDWNEIHAELIEKTQRYLSDAHEILAEHQGHFDLWKDQIEQLQQRLRKVLLVDSSERIVRSTTSAVTQHQPPRGVPLQLVQGDVRERPRALVVEYKIPQQEPESQFVVVVDNKEPSRAARPAGKPAQWEVVDGGVKPIRFELRHG